MLSKLISNTGCQVALLPNAFSLSSTFLNLVFFLLTLCKPLEQPKHVIQTRGTRIDG